MSEASTIVRTLVSIVGPKGIVTDKGELKVYECDGFSVAKGTPTAVVFPTTTQQVSQICKALTAAGVAIVPRGTGTGLAGGAVAYGGGVIISTSRMDKIEKIDLANRLAVVQAGVRNYALTEAVAYEGAPGLHFSPDPSSQKASTIGGNAATNAGGINTLKHGVTTNHILGLEMVLPDGTIMETRTAGLYDGFGPDIGGLVCGSEGTLGIVTKLWCRLVNKPKNFRTVYAVFDSTFDACKTVADVIATGIIPTSMEMMDGAMIRVVEDAFHYGFPVTAKALLLLEVDGVEEVLDDQMDLICSLAKENKATDIKQCSDPVRRAELWSARKRAFGAIGRISHSYCTQDACVPRSMLPQVVETVGLIGEKYGLKINNVFHAGDGNIHPILLFDEDKPEEVQRVLQASLEILDYCISVGGTITGEHGVGVEKLHLMPRMFNKATIGAFQEIKKTFDPQQLINDAKLIPSEKMIIELLHSGNVWPSGVNVSGGASITHV
jgi:glycolate oxidase